MSGHKVYILPHDISPSLGMGHAEVTAVETRASVTRLPGVVCGNGLAEGGLRPGCAGIEPGRGSRKPTPFRGG